MFVLGCSSLFRKRSTYSKLVAAVGGVNYAVAAMTTMRPQQNGNTSAQQQLSLPTLEGVVFDMDGTLTKPNLDFGEMYRRCGVDRSKDILQEIAAMTPEKQAEANAIIEEIEEEGRRTLELMPGARELVEWLSNHQIPMALVTRNTRKSVSVLTDRLLLLNDEQQQTTVLFSEVIPRDDGFPPKPDPTALHVIAKRWNVPLPTDGILMVGDSVSHDIVFGKNAGVRTALLDTFGQYNQKHQSTGTTMILPDIIVQDLRFLRECLLQNFYIQSKDF